MGKVGRPKLEDSAIKAVRMPVRLWRLLSKASKEYRTALIAESSSFGLPTFPISTPNIHT
jgi:hypothetical protein